MFVASAVNLVKRVILFSLNLISALPFCDPKWSFLAFFENAKRSVLQSEPMIVIVLYIIAIFFEIVAYFVNVTVRG